MKRQFLLFGLLLILFSACKKQSFNAPKQADIDDAKIKAYIAANNIDVTRDPSTGIYYKIVTVNPGPNPTINDTVQVTYSGKLLNGTVFNTGNAVLIPLSSAIQGWQLMVPKLGANGSAPYGRIRIIIPSALAYGTAPPDKDADVPIPTNSILDFTIDLIGGY